MCYSHATKIEWLHVMETKFYNISYTGIKPCPGSSVKLEQNDVLQDKTG